MRCFGPFMTSHRSPVIDGHSRLSCHHPSSHSLLVEIQVVVDCRPVRAGIERLCCVTRMRRKTGCEAIVTHHRPPTPHICDSDDDADDEWPRRTPGNRLEGVGRLFHGSGIVIIIIIISCSPFPSTPPPVANLLIVYHHSSTTAIIFTLISDCNFSKFVPKTSCDCKNISTSWRKCSTNNDEAPSASATVSAISFHWHHNNVQQLPQQLLLQPVVSAFNLHHHSCC